MRHAIGIRSARHPRAGFTLLEVIIALGLVVLVVSNIVMALNSTTKAYEAGSSRMVVEDQAHRTLDRIALAVMGSSREGLAPGQEFPLDTSSLTYQLNLGFEDGEVVWSDPERIERELGAGEVPQVTWKRNPGMPEQERVVWSKWVREFLQGEVFNGVDDNGNGLIDEKGLSFSVVGNLVTIRLSLEREGSDGNPIVVTLDTNVDIRN